MIVIDNSNAINLKKIRIWFAGKSLLIPKPVSLKKSRKPKLPGYKLFCMILCNRFDYRFGNRKYWKIKGLHGKLLQIRYKPRASHNDWGYLSFSRVLISTREFNLLLFHNKVLFFQYAIYLVSTLQHLLIPCRSSGYVSHFHHRTYFSK